MSNQTTSERLLHAIRSGNTPHGLLLCGPTGESCNDLALLAASICCTGKEDIRALENCPRFLQLGPQPILIDDVRQLEERLSYRVEGDHSRCALLLNVHNMTVQAQNAFLKTLEDPPHNTLFILTGREAGILPTIRSRCSIWRFGAQNPSEVAAALQQDGVEEKTAQLSAALSGGVLVQARTMATPTYQAFRNQALKVLMDAFGPLPPFTAMSNLLSQIFEENAPQRTPGDARRAAAGACLSIWMTFLRDVLLLGHRQGQVSAYHPDQTKQAQILAQRFTIEIIQCIIKHVAEAEKRLFLKANPALTMDRLLMQIQSTAGQSNTEEL